MLQLSLYVLNVVLGLEMSIFTSPLSAGAQKEGAAGFFKGVGKGLVGAVARPTGGIIDMASSTFQGIKRQECIDNKDLSFILQLQNFYIYLW